MGPRARSSSIKPSFQRLAHAFGDHGRIVVDGERYGALESAPAGNEYIYGVQVPTVAQAELTPPRLVAKP